MQKDKVKYASLDLRDVAASSLAQERELVSRLKRHDESAYNFLFAKYKKALRGKVLKYVTPDFIDDVLQEAFIKIWTQIERYDDSKGRFYTWMAKLTNSVAIDTVRSRRYKDAVKTSKISDFPHIDLLGSSRNGNENHIGVRSLMKSLNLTHREIFELYFLKAYSGPEVAEALNLSLGTVKTRIRNTVFAIRKLFLSDILAINPNVAPAFLGDVRLPDKPFKADIKSMKETGNPPLAKRNTQSIKQVSLKVKSRQSKIGRSTASKRIKKQKEVKVCQPPRKSIEELKLEIGRSVMELKLQGNKMVKISATLGCSKSKCDIAYSYFKSFNLKKEDLTAYHRELLILGKTVKDFQESGKKSIKDIAHVVNKPVPECWDALRFYKRTVGSPKQTNHLNVMSSESNDDHQHVA